jgi:hypothetical protein
VIWVYGICEQPGTPPPFDPGVAGAPVEGVREGALLAVISRHADEVGDPAIDSLLVHERVVERIMADRAVLPMRFGTQLPGEGALREMLATRQQELLALLDRVRGRIELAVRARRSPEAAAPKARVATGREYLEAKLRSGRLTERAAAAVHEPLAALAVAVDRRRVSEPGELLRASYLVEEAVLPQFRAAVERLQRAQPELAILCTGPWPPYSFVGADESAPVTVGSA